jgi:hypothetical protein
VLSRHGEVELRVMQVVTLFLDVGLRIGFRESDERQGWFIAFFELPT